MRLPSSPERALDRPHHPKLTGHTLRVDQAKPDCDRCPEPKWLPAAGIAPPRGTIRIYARTSLGRALRRGAPLLVALASGPYHSQGLPPGAAPANGTRFRWLTASPSQNHPHQATAGRGSLGLNRRLVASHAPVA